MVNCVTKTDPKPNFVFFNGSFNEDYQIVLYSSNKKKNAAV